MDFQFERMLADPVEGFLSGFGSSFGRLLFGFAAIATAAAICWLPLLYSPQAEEFQWHSSLLYEWFFALLFMLVAWANCGVGFFIGIASVGVLIVAYFAFAYDYQAKKSFYTTFAAATVYYLPVTFNDYRWTVTTLLFAFLSVCYWHPTGVIAFFQSFIARLKKTPG